MRVKRRLLPRCQYTVFNSGSPTLESECGEPAIAVWSFPPEIDAGETIPSPPFYVCEKCDEEIADREGDFE